MILSHFPQGIQCFCLMYPSLCTLLRHQKREWKLTFLPEIPVLSGDIPAPGFFLDNILRKGSVTESSLKRLSWKSLSAQSFGFLSCLGAVYNLAFSVFYHYGNMYYWERVEVKCLSSVLMNSKRNEPVAFYSVSHPCIQRGTFANSQDIALDENELLA